MSPGPGGPALLALDFDGVVCDSVHESSRATWHAFDTLWPGLGEEPPPGFIERCNRLRPVIESGWENYILARLIVDGVADAEIADRFQERWCPQVMRRYGLRKEALVEGFGRARDEWRARDPHAWLDSLPLYPGVGEMLRSHLASGLPLYVITTKQTRFAAAILAHHGIDLPASRLLGLETGPKTDSLQRLAREHAIAPGEIWFVEDRMATLERAMAVEALAGLGMFLVDWGYNTEAERAEAIADPRVEVLDLARFTGPLAGWRGAGAA